LLLAIVASAHADWNALSVEQDAGQTGIENRHVVVEDTGLSQRADVDVVVFSAKSCALRVIDNPEGESLSTIMKREKCVCSVNGGYFDPEFKPIGLRISNGETFSPLRRARMITGILLQSDRGVDVLRVGEFSRAKRITSAIQSGPFLVESRSLFVG